MRTSPNLTSLRRALLGGAAAAGLVALPAQALPVYAGTSQTNAGGQAPVVNATGGTVNVDLRANRTILDWTSFNLSAGETANFYFDQRNWIALNRVAGSAIDINGAVNAIQAAGVGAGPTGGNVWFYSPQGVAFGPNARVNVAGLLATSAAVNTGAFLTLNGQNIPFTGSGSGGPITVASGAQLNSSHHVALIAPRVTTAPGSNFTSGDAGTVLYGAADSFEVQLFAQNLDWTIFTFIVANAAAGTPVGTNALDLGGDTRSGTIYLAAYSRAALAGQVISAPGLLVAQSSIKEYGQVTITTGRSILLGQVGHGSEAQQVTGVTTGSVNVSGVEASGNVNIYLTGTGSLGDFNTAGGVHAGQGLLIAANDFTVGSAGIRSGDTAVQGVASRNLIIDTNGVLTTPLLQTQGNLTVFRGPAQTGRGTALPTLQLGTVSAGGNIFLSNTNRINAGAVTAGGEAQMFAALPVTLASLTTSAYTRISSSQTIAVSGAVRGADIDLRSAQGITANSLVGTNSVMVGTGGPASFATITGPSLNLDATNAQIGTATVGGDVRLRVQSLDLTGALTATNFTLEAANGAFVLGGSGPGVTLPDASFNRIRVTGAANLYAGVTAPTVNVPTPVFGDLEVRSVSLDPTRIPTLNLYANLDREVRVFGPVDTIGAASGLVRIGDPMLGSPWAPRTIKLMDPSDPIDDFAAALSPDVLQNARRFELYATGDILIGSQRFVDLVSGTPSDQIDLARGLPLGVAPTAEEANRLYLLGAQLTMAAGGRILTQNTSPTGSEVSIVLTGAGVPAGEPLLTIGRAQNAQVFVSFASASGLSSGTPVSLSNRIVRLEDDDGGSAIIFVNGCPLGVGCALSTPTSQFRIEAFAPPEPAVAALDPPLINPLPPPVDEDERESEPVITGSGNEEIWKRDQP